METMSHLYPTLLWKIARTASRRKMSMTQSLVVLLRAGLLEGTQLQAPFGPASLTKQIPSMMDHPHMRPSTIGLSTMFQGVRWTPPGRVLPDGPLPYSTTRFLMVYQVGRRMIVIARHNARHPSTMYFAGTPGDVPPIRREMLLPDHKLRLICFEMISEGAHQFGALQDAPQAFSTTIITPPLRRHHLHRSLRSTVLRLALSSTP